MTMLDLAVLVTRAGEVIEAIALLPLDRALLLAAGALSEPSLRALDAIHVAAAASLSRDIGNTCVTRSLETPRPSAGVPSLVDG